MTRQSKAIKPIVRRRSLGEDITAQLQQLIQDGTYPPGCALPSQRELARMFGTSVPSVREAISVLVATGVLDARTGSGTVVRSFATSDSEFDGWLGVAGDREELQELLQARRLLEQFTTQQLVARMTPQAGEALEAILEEMRASLDDPDRYVDADMRLHMTIATLAGNRVVCRLMRVIQHPLRHQLTLSVRELYDNGRLSDSMSDHDQMVRALRAGHAGEAFSYIDRMLGRADRLRTPAVVADEPLTAADVTAGPLQADLR